MGFRVQGEFLGMGYLGFCRVKVQGLTILQDLVLGTLLLKGTIITYKFIPSSPWSLQSPLNP